MRKNIWLAIMLALLVPAMLFTVSCAKKDVQATPEPTPEPEMTTEDTSSEDAMLEQKRMEEERLAAEAAAKEAAMQAFVNQNIHFDFDSAALTPEAQAILSAKAELLMANPDLTATIEGHCDSRGTDAYNMALGERRADSAKAFLIDMGISSSRLTTISYGEERPLDPGQNEAAYAQNRRCQFVIN